MLNKPLTQEDVGKIYRTYAGHKVLITGVVDAVECPVKFPVHTEFLSNESGDWEIKQYTKDGLIDLDNPKAPMNLAGDWILPIIKGAVLRVWDKGQERFNAQYRAFSNFDYASGKVYCFEAKLGGLVKQWDFYEVLRDCDVSTNPTPPTKPPVIPGC